MAEPKQTAQSDRTTRQRAAIRRSQTAEKRNGAKVSLPKVEFLKEKSQ